MATFLLHSLVLRNIDHEEARVAKHRIIDSRVQEANKERRLQDHARAGREIGVIVHRNGVLGEREFDAFGVAERILAL